MQDHMCHSINSRTLLSKCKKKKKQNGCGRTACENLFLLSHLHDSIIDILSTLEQQVLKDVSKGSVFTTGHNENTEILNLAPPTNSIPGSQDSYFLPILSLLNVNY